MRALPVLTLLSAALLGGCVSVATHGDPAVATGPMPDDSLNATAWYQASVERDLVYVGVVGIIDPPRAEAAEAIAEARRAGIRVIMITGDHPTTASRIAADLSASSSGAVGP